MPRTATGDYRATPDNFLPHHVPRHFGTYSLAKAIRQATRGTLDGLEKETSDEIAVRSGHKPAGFFVPWDVNVRALTSTTGSGAIPTILSGELIDVLRAKMVTSALGALTLPDLRGGRFAIPRKTATVTLARIIH